MRIKDYTEEDLKKVKREWFETPASYDSFILAARYGMKVNEFLRNGFILINEDMDKQEPFCLDLDENESMVMNGCIMVQGHTHSCEDHLIYCELEETLEYFKDFKIIDPKDIKKLEL